MRNLTNTCLTIFVICALGIVGSKAFASPTTSTNTVEQVEDFARWEFRAAPIPVLFRWLIIDASYRLSEKVSLGPSLIIYDHPEDRARSMFTPNVNGYAAGINSMYYFSSVAKNTWYSSFHAYYQDYTVYPHGLSNQIDENIGFTSNAAIGYHWRKSRFTFLVGGGIEYYSLSEKTIRTDIDNNVSITNDSESGFVPFVEFKLGIEI